MANAKKKKRAMRSVKSGVKAAALDIACSRILDRMVKKGIFTK
jgi:hypothetical protein